MKLLSQKSYGSFANLIADSILMLLKNKSIISVTISDNIILINGITTSNNILPTNTIKNTIYSCSLDTFGKIEDFEVIETIKYNQQVPENYNIHNLKVYNNSRPVFEPDVPPSNENKLQYISEFPYGYSLECGRLVLYYSEMIFKNIRNSIGLESGEFSIENKTIRFDGKCFLSNQSVESLILDYFDFDFFSFMENVTGYDFTRDIKYPFEIKPWLKDDLMLKIQVF